MTRTQSRVMITLVVIVFGAIGVVGLLIIVQDDAWQHQQEARRKQKELQIQEPRAEQELPREQEPRLQREPRQAQEQQQSQKPIPEKKAAQASVSSVITDVRALRAQIMDYKKRSGAYPTTAQGLRVLGAAHKDPWGSDYVYDYPSTRNREFYDLFSAGPDGKPDTPDDNWGEESEQLQPTESAADETEPQPKP